LVWVVGDQTIDNNETGTSFRQVLHFKEVGFNLYDTMIYETNKQPLNDKRYEPKFEYMFVLSKGKPKTFNPLMEKSQYAGKTARGRTKYLPDGSKQAFSSQGKIKDMKVRGNIWFYSSGANGTTKDNVNHPAMFPGYIGFEISQEYCEVARRRVASANVPLFVEK